MEDITIIFETMCKYSDSQIKFYIDEEGLYVFEIEIYNEYQECYISSQVTLCRPQATRFAQAIITESIIDSKPIKRIEE